MNDTLKYLGYARKSSEDKDRQAQSIDTQTAILKEYARKHEINLVDILMESKSAKDDGNRPMFTSLLDRLKSGEANAIFVAHIDRLARNGIEAGQLIKLFLAGNIKEILTPSKCYNTIQDLLYLDIEFAFASDYSRRLSLRVKEGIQAKLNRGEYPNLAPIGYTNKNGKIIPDPSTAPLVTQLFSEYATGNYSIKGITQYIQNMGLVSKVKKSPIGKSVVHRTLNDPIYYGAIRNRSKLYQGIHQPLINKALFDKVQILLTGKKVKGNTKLYFLYKSYLSCDVCGCKITASRKKGRYVYYYCTNGKGTCDEHLEYLPASRVEKIIGDTLASFSLPGDLATESLRVYADELQRKSANQDTARTHLAKSLSAVEAKLDRLEDMRLDGEISADRYAIKKAKIEQQIKDIKNQSTHSPTKSIDTTLELLEKFKDQAVNIGEMFKYGDEAVKLDLLKSALWNCKIRDGKIISTRYKKPFSYVEGLSKTTNRTTWRRRWDSNPRTS